MARRKIDEAVKRGAIEAMRNGTPGIDVSKEFGIAQSTLSRWRHEYGIGEAQYVNGVLRSKPLPEDKTTTPASAAVSDPSTQARKDMLDKSMQLISELLAGGGLKSHDVKNLSLSARHIAEAHRKETAIEEAELASQASSAGPKGGASDYADLVSLRPDGTPKNIGALFATLDLGAALLEDDREGEEAAKERIRAACVSAGLSAVGVPFDDMVKIALANSGSRAPSGAEHTEKNGVSSEGQAKPEDAVAREPEFDGQGLA